MSLDDHRDDADQQQNSHEPAETEPRNKQPLLGRLVGGHRPHGTDPRPRSRSEAGGRASGEQRAPEVPLPAPISPVDPVTAGPAHPGVFPELPQAAAPSAHVPSAQTTSPAPISARDSGFPPAPDAPSPATVEAVGQAAVLQRALINHGEMIGKKYVFEQTLDSHAPIAPEYLAVMREVYAEPRREDDAWLTSPFDGALAALRPAGSILVLSRPPDSGRTITAYVLLGRLLDEGVITEVRPIPFGGSQHFPTRRLPHDHRCGYLLELPPDEDDFAIDASFGAGLRKISERLERRGSRLIVLTRPEQWRRLCQGAPEEAAPELGTARCRDIAERWLLAQEPGFPVDAWLKHADIQRLLDGQSPTDVLNLVYLLLEQHRTAQQAIAAMDDALRQQQQAVPARTFEEQVADVVAAHSNWEDALYEWHEPEERSRTSFERNFLLTASVLRGDPVGHVYAKAAELTATLDKSVFKVDGQQAPGVIAMTRAAKARRVDDGSLVFDRPHWDDAAIEYFWNDRPLARTTFLRWLAQAPVDTSASKEALETISKDDRRALAGRIGQFALRWAVRHRRQEPLEEIVKAWYLHGTDKELWPLAVELLDSAAIHAVSAPYIHSMLLGWAGRKEPSLQRAVVAVCTGEFGRRHTGKALRRLRHVADKGLPDVIDALRDAVCVLWSDPTVRSMLFSYVVEWCRSDTTRDTVGHRTFAALATSSPPGAEGLPLLLQAQSDKEPADEDTFQPPVAGLVAGWRTLLRQATGAAGARELDTAVFLWLDTALQKQPLRPLIFETLREAVNVRGSEGPNLRETLRTCAEMWVQGPDRPYSEEKESLKRDLSALLDNDLVAVRRLQSGTQQTPAPPEPGPIGPGDAEAAAGVDAA
ncbi:hypothetical protein [Streptomyces sp. NPDC057199]|uniref:hypothetical protein n=1 Tax=Streptomyces sp. NPDC057199 TaxID=3346047 RepID=UPI00363E0111